MSNDIDKGNFGDSARNRLAVQRKSSNHVFDGAGENVQHHSDNESLSSRKSRTRFINPAIYVEKVESSQSAVSLGGDSFDENITPHPHTTYRSNSTPYLSGRESTSSGSVKRISCRLNCDLHGSDEVEDTPRMDRTYRDNGQDTFRLSVASLSTTTTSKEERERNQQKKQEAYKKWLAKKEQEKREKARLEKMQQQPTRAVTDEQREESFRRWLERKREQNERRRAETMTQQYRHNERIERERQKHDREKDDKLAVWIRKKEEEMKSMKTREERTAARLAIENEKRRVNGERAYRDWLRTSKNKPLPVPLNQGELSMRGSVSQMYINPKPWKSLI